MPASVRAFSFHLLHYRRSWLGTAISYFVTPAMLLAALGLGFGALAADGRFAAVAGGYFGFLAPGLTAVVVVDAVAAEGMWRTYAGFNWDKAYLVQRQTPLSPGSMVAGHFLFMLVKALIVASCFAVVAVLMRPAVAASVIGSIPAALLTGCAWGAVLMVVALRFRSSAAFVPIQRLVLVPTTMLSGALFPVAVLPGWLQAVMLVNPSWHGVAAVRAVTGDPARPGSALIHLAVLAAICAVALALAGRAMAHRLED